MADPTATPEPTDAAMPTADATAPQDPALTGGSIAAPEAMPQEQLQATSSDSGTPTTSSSEAQPTEPAYEEQPVEYADPRTAYQPPETTGTDADLLTGPPTADEQAFPYNPADSVPAQAQHWLPALQTAASAPGAPPEYQNLLKLVVANIQAAASGE